MPTVRRVYFSLPLSLLLFLTSLNYPLTISACKSNETETGIGCIPNDPAGFVNVVLSVAIGLAGGVAFLLLVYGGFRMVFSQGSPDAIQDAREIITSAIFGLIIVVFSVFILRLVGISILGLPI